MKSIRKKILVWMLLVAMLPQSLFILVAEAAQEVMRQKPDVEVRWLPVRDEILVGEEGAIVLEASLNKYQEKIQSADVEIRLEPQEVEALQEFRDGRGYLDDEEELYSDRGDIPISLSMDGDGGGILRFSLDLGRRSLRQRFHFMIPADSEELYNIEVTEEDIEVILMETEVTSREEENPLQAEDKEQETKDATPGDATPGQAKMAFGKRAGISKKSWPLLAAPLEKATDSGAQPEPPFATPAISASKDQKNEPDEEETEEIPVYVLKEAETLYIKATFDWSLKLEEESRMDQFSFTVEAEPEGEKGSLLTGSQALRLRVLLPEWLCLPEGEYSYEPENHQIMGGPWAVARLEGIPEGGQIVDVYPEDGNTLSFSLIRLQEGKSEEELEGLKLSMTLFGENLVMKDAKAEAARGIGEGLTAEEAAERAVIRESSFKEFSEEESEGMRIGTPYKALMEKDEQARVLSGPGVSKDHREGEIKVSAHLISVPMAGAERASLRTARESVQVRAEDLLRSEIAEVVIDDWEAMEENIFWADNLDEDRVRPGADKFTSGCVLYYKKKLVREGTASVAGPDWSEIEENQLTKETWQEVGLDSKPVINYTDYGGNGLLSVQKLPSQITETDIYNNSKTYEIQWILKLPACEEGYALTEVTQEDINNGTVSVGTPGWYYVRKTDFKFHIQWFMGGEELTDAMRHKAWEQLQLNVRFENGSDWQDGETNLAELIEDGEVGFFPSPNGADFTLKGIWKYNLDGSPISYWISEEEEGGSADGKMDMEGDAFDQGDYLTIAYNNAGASENQNAEDGVYNGGTIRLTRTGTKDYKATKRWLDEGGEAAALRPDGVYEIWRYRAGKSYNTAAPYRVEGRIVTIEFSTEENSYSLSYEDLPKYDAEGYEYLYVVREYLNPETPEGNPAASYEQVFGSISESGIITDRVDDGNGHLSDTATRQENNTFLYNGGTLSNRITGTVPTEVTKIWRAAAFQADFENVAVELTLYGRILGDEDGEWKAVKTADGRLVTTLIDDFTAENLTVRTYNASMPRYDALGRELEYMWQETAVYQKNEDGEQGENLLEGGHFTLEQGGRTVTYRSEATVSDADGTFATTVENSIADEIRYDLEKIWINEDREPIDGPSAESGIEEVTFQLYRVISGQTVTAENLVGSFTADGKPDQNPVKLTYEDETAEKDQTILVQEISSWNFKLTGLPEFDPEGREYEYILLEVTDENSDYYPTYTTTRDEDNNYHTRVVNGPGEGHRIMVQKSWYDDGDIMHREDIVVGVFVRDTHNQIATASLAGGVWQKQVGIGAYTPEEVYVLELQVGETEIPRPVDEDGDPVVPDLHTRTQYETSHHKYDVSYLELEEIAGESFYTIVNRRLGNVNLTVTKNWIDGDGSRRKEIEEELKRLKEEDDVTLFPRIQLQFANEYGDAYKIGEYSEVGPEGGYVNIGGSNVPIRDDNDKPASSLQELSLATDSNSQELYFFNLPKYNEGGTVVNYTAKEVWVDSSGKVLTDSEISEKYPKLYQLISQYTTSIVQTSYKPSDLRDEDEQKITVTNRLGGTKDVTWHKQWEDEYNHQQGLRPDIYLDVYGVSSNPEGSQEPKLVVENYRWTYADIPDDDEGSQDRYNSTRHWHAVISGLDQYDEDGYEIYYYAVEDTQVDPENFDYKPVAYYLENVKDPDQPVYIGSETESAAEYKDYVYNIAEAGKSPRYALREDGTFTNTISDVVTIRGQKIWSNLPDSYPSGDLPTVTFALAQKLGDQVVVEEYATVTVGGWDQLSTSGGAYSFSIAYKGENNSNGDYVGSGEDERLPRYDEHGNMYSYELYEKSIVWQGPDEDLEEEKVFDFATASNSYRIENIYRPATGSIAFDKILYIPKGDDGEPLAYPGVKFQVSRSYTKNSGDPSEPEIVEIQGEDELVWTSAEVKKDYLEASTSNADKGGPNWLRKTFTLENLPLYAPNGSDYVYTITEIKDDFMEGYDTWTAEGEVADVPVSVDENPLPVGWKQPVDGEAPALTELKAQEIADGAETSVQGTFINQVRQGTVTLTGEKRWEDYDNHFGFRPDGPNDSTMKNPVELTLYRSAPTQEEQENPIGLEPVPKESYTIEWSWDKSDNSKWTYTIEGVENRGELELYAPNGRLWQYTVRETLPKDSPYTVTPEAPEDASEDGQAAQKQYTGDDQIQMNPLTNSIMTSKSFRKQWVDEANEEIKEDYLGFNLSVTFKLQVAVLDDDGQITNGGWEDAAEFFSEDEKENLWGTRDYSFTQKIEDYRIDAASWGTNRTFDDLPIVLQRESENSKNTLHLTYRVVESEISYGNQTITVEAEDVQGNQTYTYKFSQDNQSDNLLFAPAYAEGGSNNANTTWHVNQLRTSGITVEKNWVNDNKNAYHTRPMNEAGTRWETNFVIQRATASNASSVPEETAWENVTDGEVSLLLLQITGEEGTDSGRGTVEGLPIQDAYGNTYYYRAVELEPDWNDDGNLDETEMIEDKGFYYQGTYKAEYTYDYDKDSTTVSNQLQTTRAEAVKDWNMPESDQTNLPIVTMTLQYQNKSGTWTDLASVTLNGEKDEKPEKPYYEYDSWKARWENLPQVYPGSQLKDRKTQYRVIESNIPGYIQEGETQIATSSNAESLNNPGDDGLITTYTFINVPATSLTVEKEWVVERGAQTPEVTVGLYRLVEGGKYTPVPDPAKPNQDWTQTLSAAKNWKATFGKLPMYAPAEANLPGDKYQYTVRETAIGGKPVKDWETEDFYVYQKNTSENGNLSFLIRNVQKIDLTVVKEWKDYDNSYNTRPDDLKISLERKVEGGKFQSVPKISHTEWEKVGNRWTCRYENLPYANRHGQVYEYQVTETVPDVAGALGDAGEKYTAANNGIAIKKGDGRFYLTNTLTDNTVELEITKNWIDGGDADRLRPDEITVELYGNGVKVGDYTFNQGGNLLTDILEAVTGRTGDSWTCTIKKLPEYDSEGKRIQYTIGEARIDGYKAQVVKQPDDEPDDNRYTAVLSNTLLTSLPVEKIWGGVASQDQEEVVVGLYQAAAKDNPQEESPKPYEDENGNQITLKLNETNGWQGEFTDLPRFNPAGSRYHYTAQELTVGGVPVDETGYIVEITNQPAGAQKATASIANIATTSIAGRKIWVDNRNAYGLRPESLTLKLYRSTGKGTEEQVSEEPKWTDNTGNNWDYCYENLPATDQKGDAYTYRVEEIVPDGYQAATSSNAKGGVDFTNTLSRQISISGTKTWRDGGSASRPEKIELILERQTDGNDGWSRINRTPQWSGQETDVWTYTFTDLEEFNSQGLRYTYRVREAKVPEGYDVYYSGNDIENVRKGALTVTKTVSGNRGETERQFHFTVTLSDASINGTFGSMTFKGGIAQFTLKHGETLRAVGLPGGISYTVTEQEDDQEGYSTTSTGAQGTIPEGGIAAVSFNNHRSRSGSSGNPSSDSDPTGSRAYTFTDGGPSVTNQTTTSNVTSTDATSTTTPPWPFEVVKTGDQSRLRRYLTMFMISLAGLVILLMIGLTKGRKKKK